MFQRSADSKSHEFDVILGESSVFEEINWRFPKTSKCPLEDCKLSCSSPAIAVMHFALQHAKTTMICIICDKLFPVENPTSLLNHYEINHPTEALPKYKSVMKLFARSFTSIFDRYSPFLNRLILTQMTTKLKKTASWMPKIPTEQRMKTVI